MATWRGRRRCCAWRCAAPHAWPSARLARSSTCGSRSRSRGHIGGRSGRAAAVLAALARLCSLQLLLQRPLWMDAWRRGEEERAVLLWAKLPDNIMNTILDLLEQQRLAAKASRLPRKWARSFRAYERGRRRGSLEPGLAVCGRERAPSNWFCQLACVYVCARCRSCINVGMVQP